MQQDQIVDEMSADHRQLLDAHWQRLKCFLEEWSCGQEALLRCSTPVQPALPAEGKSSQPGADPEVMEIWNHGSEATSVSEFRYGGSSQQKDKTPVTNSQPQLVTSSSDITVTLAEEADENAKHASPVKHNSDVSLEGEASDETSHVYFKRKKFKTKALTHVHGLVKNQVFAYTSALVILANGITIGVASDYAMRHPLRPEWPLLNNLELAFTVFYTTEIMLVLYVERSKFCYGSDWKWNTFDVMLVTQSLYEQLTRRVSNFQQPGQNMSFLRMFRLMKMMKLLRMIRLMRAFRELRLILSSFFGAARAMTWAMVLVFLLSYTFGICIMQSCAGYLHDEGSSADVEARQGIDEYWGSVLKSILSLYMAVTGGCDWQDLARPLKKVGWLAFGVFVIYITLFMFVIVNTISSIFIESMMSNAANDHQLVIEMQMDQQNEYIDKLQDLYDMMDDDNDGQVTFQEFLNHMNTQEMKAFVNSLDIDASDARQFFDVLSDRGKRTVDVQTFVEGCIRLKGMAKSLDLMTLVYSFKHATHEAKAFQKESNKCLARVETLLTNNFARVEKLVGHSVVNNQPSMATILNTMSDINVSLQMLQSVSKEAASRAEAATQAPDKAGDGGRKHASLTL